MTTTHVELPLFEATAPPRSFISLNDLERLCRERPTDYLIEGLLPADDVHVAVGDSGLGKTPWAYQLGLCVATGEPFLGYSTRQGRVLYLDLENGLMLSFRLPDRYAVTLELSVSLTNFWY